MSRLAHLFQNNHAWAESMDARRPGLFASLAWQRAPRYLWIGCTDSRVREGRLCELNVVE